MLVALNDNHPEYFTNDEFKKIKKDESTIF